VAETKQVRRVRYAAAAILMQILLGILYSWSVFRGPLEQLHGWSRAQSVMPYRYSLLAFAAGMIVAGLWQDRKGPRLVASVGGMLLALGCAVAGLLHQTVQGLVLGYGVIAGVGVGFAYVTPIAMCVKWFPDRRGMIVGLAVMGFGLGPLVFGPWLEWMIGKNVAVMNETIPKTFFVLSGLFLVGVVGAAQLYAVPPAGWKPEGWTPAAGKMTMTEIGPAEMTRGWRFWALWAVYFLGTSVGLTAIGEASPLLREAARGGASMTAGAGLGVMSIFNGLGRLAWGGVSDRWGRQTALLGMCGVSVVACAAVLRTAEGFSLLLLGMCLVAWSYGGYLALMPALTADFFGAKHVGANYGLLFSAWGICGFLVPGYFAGVLDAARAAGNLRSGYEHVFGLLAALALVGGVIGLSLNAQKPAAAVKQVSQS
jgi:OFA family oxalate/formate antiporter-like MFS transporter